MEIELHNQQVTFAVTTRAIAIHEGKLLMCRQKNTDGFLALPGGKLNIGETITAGLVRELLEETGVRAQIGEMLFINEWVGSDDHRLEFFCWVLNAGDFIKADFASASHGHEISYLGFGDPTGASTNLLPTFIADRFERLLELGEKLPLEHIRSI